MGDGPRPEILVYFNSPTSEQAVLKSCSDGSVLVLFSLPKELNFDYIFIKPIHWIQTVHAFFSDFMLKWTFWIGAESI